MAGPSVRCFTNSNQHVHGRIASQFPKADGSQVHCGTHYTAAPFLSDPRIASRFLIEVRENVLARSVRKDQGLLAQLLALKCYEWGVRLCVDGVGGALWRLGILKDLPVALAKIDSRFVGDILINRDSETLVRSAVQWGQGAGVEIAATGVDTPAIAERLRALGVRYGQGSAFGTAEPIGLTLAGLYS